MIGQYLGLTHAGRFHTLTLSNTFSVAQQDMKNSLQERIAIARAKGMQGLVQSTMERWFTPSFIQNDSPDFRMIQQQFLKTPVEGFVGCCQAIPGLNYADRLAGMTVPTLVMVGEEDPGTPVPWARAIHERIKNSKFVIIPSAQHCSNVEQPQVFNATLLEFLRAHDEIAPVQRTSKR
jgi:3-oxoadipate enol-lactonase